jgi:hypothetical protein
VEILCSDVDATRTSLRSLWRRCTPRSIALLDLEERGPAAALRDLEHALAGGDGGPSPATVRGGVASALGYRDSAEATFSKE